MQTITVCIIHGIVSERVVLAHKTWTLSIMITKLLTLSDDGCKNDNVIYSFVYIAYGFKLIKYQTLMNY